MAKKAADKCKYLAKYIYVKHPRRKTGSGGRSREKGRAPAASQSHPVLAVSRNKASKPSPNMVSSLNTTACL